MSVYTKFSAKQLFFGGLLVPAVAGIFAASFFFANDAFSNSALTSSDGRHIRGAKNAKVTLVEYSDFECPFCERHYPTLKQILKDFEGKVNLEYKHYPLSFHPNAQKAAEASECAADQGKFWEFHDYIFEHQDSLTVEALPQWASAIGLNTSKFTDCLNSGKYAAKVTSQYQEGERLGVRGTPATFVNGELVSGAVPYETLKAAVQKHLQ